MMIDNSLINWPEEKVEKLKAHYAEILSLLGEDPNREGLLKTPERVAKAMLTLTRGYEMDPREVLNAANWLIMSNCKKTDNRRAKGNTSPMRRCPGGRHRNFTGRKSAILWQTPAAYVILQDEL